MSKYKLVLSSIKNQLHIYSIYIVSLVFSFTFYLTFINLSISSIAATTNYTVQSKIYMAVVFLIAVLFAALIIYMINYVQTLLINARSKELAVYRLVSFSSKELRKYLFVEQLIINAFAFIVAIIFSYILSVVIIDNFNTTVDAIFGIQMNVQFSITTLIYELLSLFVISIVVTRLATHKVEKKELIELLQTKHALPDQNSDRSSLLNLVIVMATWLGLMYILVVQINHLKYITIVIVLIIYIISIFSIYNVLASVVVKLIPRKLYYRGSNSFTTSIIKRKLSSNAVSMAFVTVLIITSTFTLCFGFINTKYISYLAMYNDVSFNTDFTSVPFEYNGDSYNYEFYRYYFPNYSIDSNSDYLITSEYSYNAFAKDNGLAEQVIDSDSAIVLSKNPSTVPSKLIMHDEEEHQYELNVNQVFEITAQDVDNIVIVDDTYDVDITEYINNFYTELESIGANPIHNRFKGIYATLYKQDTKISDYINIMSQSIANQYLKQLGVEEQLSLDSNQMGYMGMLPYNINDQYTLKTSDKSYEMTQVITGQELNTFGFGVYVLNDQEYNQIDGSSTEYINATYTNQYNEQYWVDFDATGEFPSWISTKSARNSLMLVTSVLMSGALIFASLIMMLLLITMIGVQVNIDSIETKEQFKNLSRIGYSRKKIHTIINKITLIYFIIPLIIGILNIALLVTVFNNYFIDYTTTSLIFTSGAIAVSELAYIGLFMLLIYVLYCILVNISYKRVIDKNFD